MLAKMLFTVSSWHLIHLLMLMNYTILHSTPNTTQKQANMSLAKLRKLQTLQFSRRRYELSMSASVRPMNLCKTTFDGFDWTHCLLLKVDEPIYCVILFSIKCILAFYYWHLAFSPAVYVTHFHMFHKSRSTA